MPDGMDEPIEYDTLFSAHHGRHSIPRRLRRIRALRSSTALDLAEAELDVTALRHSLLFFDHNIRAICLGTSRRPDDAEP